MVGSRISDPNPLNRLWINDTLRPSASTATTATVSPDGRPTPDSSSPANGCPATCSANRCSGAAVEQFSDVDSHRLGVGEQTVAFALCEVEGQGQSGRGNPAVQGGVVIAGGCQHAEQARHHVGLTVRASGEDPPGVDVSGESRRLVDGERGEVLAGDRDAAGGQAGAQGIGEVACVHHTGSINGDPRQRPPQSGLRERLTSGEWGSGWGKHRREVRVVAQERHGLVDGGGEARRDRQRPPVRR